MKFKFDQAKGIKPMVVRFSVLTYDGDDLIAENDIAVDIDPHVKYEEKEGAIQINVDVSAIQQHVTTQIAEMALTNHIANGLKGLEWEAFEQDENPNESTENGPDPDVSATN